MPFYVPFGGGHGGSIIYITQIMFTSGTVKICHLLKIVKLT